MKNHSTLSGNLQHIMIKQYLSFSIVQNTPAVISGAVLLRDVKHDEMVSLFFDKPVL